MNNRTFDLICMGRAAVDLYALQIGVPLENVSSFAKYVGGCPANIAIGCSRLGLKAAMLTRVGDEAMGRFVRNTLIEEGVNVDCVKSDPQKLTGLVILGIEPPDHFPLIFYRENCADMAIERSDISEQFIGSAKALLVTGTHCSKQEIFEITKYAVETAIRVGTKVILDIDYRPVLWGLTGHGEGENRYVSCSLVSERLSEIIPHCELIVGTEEELLAASNQSTIEKAIVFLKEHSNGMIIQKRGGEGCLLYDPKQSQPIIGKPYSIDILNVLGAGDAFMSGLLRGYLRDMPLEQCCSIANANGALVVTRHGCSPAMPYWEELQYFINHPLAFNETIQMHESISKEKKINGLCLLAFDHRKHFEELSVKYAMDETHIHKFKSLVYEAFKKVKSSLNTTEMGMIVDGQYGKNILLDASKESIFTSQCIESPNAYPLHFIDGKKASEILSEWPKNQCVKVLCYVHSGQEALEQIVRLKELFDSTRESGHHLLIELIDNEQNDHLKSVREMISACYKNAVCPRWWKLQAIDDLASWIEIETMIEENDPHMQGILLLGENKPLEGMGDLFSKIASQCPKVKGFAIGRTIWGDVAEQWFQRKISDEIAISEVANKFTYLVNRWGADRK